MRMMLEAIRKAMGKRLIFLTLALIAAVAVEVLATCAIPEWRNFFYTILEHRDLTNFNLALYYFIILITLLSISQSIKSWLAQSLGATIRAALTKILFKKWVRSDMQYDNYTQAMTVSVKDMLENAIEISIEVVISAFIVFGMIFSMTNGVILWSAIAYTIAVSVLALIFNKPLIHRNKDLQASESTLRETICSSANGNHKFTFKSDLEYSMKCYSKYIRILLGYGSFYKVKSSLSVLIPYLILSGPYFANTIGLGEFMSGVGSFELFVVNTTLLLSYYPKLMQCRASFILVETFYKELHDEHSI